jgi:hypothetical protein
MKRLVILAAVVIVAALAASAVVSFPDGTVGHSTPMAASTPSATQSTATAGPAADTGPSSTRSPSPTQTPSPTPTATPTPADPDADGLSSRRERSLGTDPQHKTLLVAVYYAAGVRQLTPLEREEMRTHFAGMDVPNPDGRTGITLRFVGNTTTNDRLAVDQPTLRALQQSYITNETIAEPCVEYLLGIAPTETAVGGLAPAPGHVALTGSNYDGRTRTKVMTHELLHNIVGLLDASHENVTDDGAHTTLGWLSHGEAYRTLSEPTAAKLSADGFSEPAYCR